MTLDEYEIILKSDWLIQIQSISKAKSEKITDKAAL